MQISEILLVFFHWVRPVVVHKQLHYFVGPILDSQSQQFVPIAKVFRLQQLQFQFFKKVANQRLVIFDHCVVHWQELFKV